MQTTYTHRKSKTELATWSARAAAFLLDALLLLTLVGIADFFTFSSNDAVLLLKPERLLHLMLGWLYFAGTETCPCQGTVGKYLMNLRVTDDHGERISFRAATLRFFLRPASLVIIFFRILLGTFHNTSRTFHDKVAASRVVQR
ncbi:RDD family protein [Pontibacter mangrovi]|uniref:RDD family protein n=1 Tax=Pontibacter mangrovi TaxID=2589816 RepID=A0A501W5E6_9BACT|nr:RDD family protein [Pontibacter mangrovi]TPE43500.1 RDD family protein [Pontibacter mangrovi]